MTDSFLYNTKSKASFIFDSTILFLLLHRNCNNKEDQESMSSIIQNRKRKFHVNYTKGAKEVKAV